MQLEATQLLATTLWVDKYLGFIPRALTPDEWLVIKNAKAAEPAIDERTFTRYLPCHQNHPSAIWMRSSLAHYEWTVNYVNALQSESLYRGRNLHASCAECNRLPSPNKLQDAGFVRPFQAMPPEIKSNDVVLDYQLFYMIDKAPFATWTKRNKPHWWDENIALYDKRYTAMTIDERKRTGWY